MRDLDPAWVSAVEAGVVRPALLAELTFFSGVHRVWTGYGPLTWNANTFLGVGRLAGVGAVNEGIAVRAEGTTISLSGVDPALYSASISDVQTGAPARLWLAFLYQGAFLGAPYKIFEGVVDKPDTSTGPDAKTITLALESKMSNLKRASCARYTSADQNIKFPGDSAFNGVERLADMALKWGTA